MSVGTTDDLVWSREGNPVHGHKNHVIIDGIRFSTLRIKVDSIGIYTCTNTVTRDEESIDITAGSS